VEWSEIVERSVLSVRGNLARGRGGERQDGNFRKVMLKRRQLLVVRAKVVTPL
jgi:hypothetical protein